MNIKPLWHHRDRGVLFDGNILTNHNYSSKIRGRMDVFYVSYLYFRAEIANYKENLYFLGGNCAKTLSITKNPDLLDGLLIILKGALLLFKK